tara:strand:- start:8071 stop:8721 length:651 start_codon:yes stop_codon:yes gene_type:complete
LSIVGRHQRWASWRDRILDYIATEPGCDGEAYAPLSHPDLASIPSWNSQERLEAIVSNMDPAGVSVLDIGAHLGYFSVQLESLGRSCVALEQDERTYSLLLQQRTIHRCRFTCLLQDACSWQGLSGPFDTVLALAVFHHMLKTKYGQTELERLLARLSTSELFLWVHDPLEQQMQGAYWNPEPEEFCAFVSEATGLLCLTSLGFFNRRQLFRLARP